MDKRYDHASAELEARALWEQHKIYSYTPQEDKQTYSIDTPPPTVSGKLHIGHVFSYTHTDVIARYKRMQGFNVFYPMGFDDNGLPTERFVEKKNKTKAHLMKRSDFIKLCLQETEEVEKVFIELWKRLGLSVDWDTVYSTISDESRKIAQHDFLKLYEQGLVYRQYEPSLYCTTCRTSVAQAEVENHEFSSTFNDIEFEMEDGEKVVISTTRPELIPACIGLMYHPSDDRYKHLKGRFGVEPVSGKKLTIIPDEKVDPEKGSGLVMVSTFGDQTDIYWYKTYKDEYNLPFRCIIGFDGKFTSEAGPLEGLRAHEARKKALEILKEQGKLLSQKPIKHAVNTHERCKQEIEYLSLTQWFVKILEHKKEFLAQAEKINWKPAFMKARYRDWVENLNWDWCISRQRFYGIAFPVWHCQDCNQVLLASAKDLPIDPQETAFPGGACTACSSTNIRPDTDVMDTWNTSSLTPKINLKWPEGSPLGLTEPMSLRPQAHDIIRTWAFYTIVKSFYHGKKLPWGNIMISGHVLAGKEKISKSKGNQKMAPETLLDTYPADVIRFWTASGKLGMDTAFSENQLKIGQKLVTKLWNAFRFCSEHIKQHDKNSKPEKLDPLNQWLLHNLSATVVEYQKQFDDYEYSHALDAVERFFWHDFCDNYLELVKDRFFNPDKYSQEVLAATRFTLYEVGFAILQLYAPILPHITEKLYQLFFSAQEGIVSLQITKLDQNRCTYAFPESIQRMETVLNAVSLVRKLKSENQISLGAALGQLTIYCADQQTLSQLQEQEALLSGITRAQCVVFECAENKESSLQQDGELHNACVQL